VALLDLPPARTRQLDLLLNEAPVRQKCEKVSGVIDRINGKYGRTLVSLGPWTPPPGRHAGGKISYTRIPRAEDFW
jgi:DNA polymerase-4